jgi:hypothetical protein
VGLEPALDYLEQHLGLANPETTILIGSETRDVRARAANEEERERLWPEFVAFYPGYEFFRANAGDRELPIVILEPR